MAAAGKQLNINPSLGLVPMQGQGILPQTSPVGRNTPLKKESPPLGFVGPISSQTHLLLFSEPISGKKYKVIGLRAQLRGDCKSSLRKGGAPSPTPRKGRGETWGQEESAKLPQHPSKRGSHRVPVSGQTRLLPLLPHSVELHCLFLGSFAAPGVAPQGCTPALSSVNGSCSSQGI